LFFIFVPTPSKALNRNLQAAKSGKKDEWKRRLADELSEVDFCIDPAVRKKL